VGLDLYLIVVGFVTMVFGEYSHYVEILITLTKRYIVNFAIMTVNVCNVHLIKMCFIKRYSLCTFKRKNVLF